MSDEQVPDIPRALTRVETVVIDGESLIAVVIEHEGVAVPVRTICLALGLDPRSQVERLQQHEVLARGLRIVRVPLDGRVRAVVAILHEYIPFFLSTISPHQVADAVRPRLVLFQTELKDILAALYVPTSPQAATAPAIEALRRQILSELRQLRAELQAERARTGERLDAQDLQITTIQGVLDQRLGDLAQQLQDQQQRLDDQQALIDEILPITPAQRQYIKGTLQRIAGHVKRTTGRDMFAKLFGDFSWELGTPSYEALPATRYDEALAWLRRKATEMGCPEVVEVQQERMF